MLSSQEQFLPVGNILLLLLDQQLEQLTVQTIANLSAEREFTFLFIYLILKIYSIIQ